MSLSDQFTRVKRLKQGEFNTTKKTDGSGTLFLEAACQSTLTSMSIIFRLTPEVAAMMPFLSKAALALFRANYVFRELLRFVFPYASVPDNYADCIRVFCWLAQPRPYERATRFWLDASGCAVKRNKTTAIVYERWPLKVQQVYHLDEARRDDNESDDNDNDVDDDDDVNDDDVYWENGGVVAREHAYWRADNDDSIIHHEQCAFCHQQSRKSLAKHVHSIRGSHALFRESTVTEPVGFSTGETCVFSCLLKRDYLLDFPADSYTFNPTRMRAGTDAYDAPTCVTTRDDRSSGWSCKDLYVFVNNRFINDDSESEEVGNSNHTGTVEKDNNAPDDKATSADREMYATGDGDAERGSRILVFVRPALPPEGISERVPTRVLRYRALICTGYDHVTKTAYLVHSKSVTVVDLASPDEVVFRTYRFARSEIESLGGVGGVRMFGALFVGVTKQNLSRIVTIDMRHVNARNEVVVHVYRPAKLRGRSIHFSGRSLDDDGSLVLAYEETSGYHYPQFIARAPPWVV